ncbi:MAG: response regulator transcription factor [Flavobacteriales bacterium]|jgi:two-component system LytT family response regulator|nr:response regulator transcription factor [Flavobacteriales bacterium]
MAELIKTVLIDDEPNALEVMRKLIENYCPGIIICGTAHNLVTGIEAIQQHKPQLVFLDIEMPLGSGFDLLRELPDRDFHVIFTTAYDQYALKAIKEQAIDYILKPIDIDDLCDAVDKVKKFELAPSTGSGDILIHQLGKSKMLAIPTMYGFKIVEQSEIVSIAADGSYSTVVLRDLQKIVVSKNLKSVELALDPEVFMRVHRSHIINLAEIREFHKSDGGFVIMSTGERVEVGITNRHTLQEKLNNRLNYI